MECIYCKKEIGEEASFCPYCGKKQNQENVSEKTKNKKIVISSLLSVLLLTIIIAIVVLRGKEITTVPVEIKEYNVDDGEYILRRETKFDARGRLLRDSYFYGGEPGDQYEYFYEDKEMSDYVFSFEGESIHIEPETEYDKAKNMVNYYIYDEAGDTFFEEITIEYIENERILNQYSVYEDTMFAEYFKNSKPAGKELILGDKKEYDHRVEYDDYGIILSGTVEEDGVSTSVSYNVIKENDSSGNLSKAIALRENEIECEFQSDLAYDKIIYFFDIQEKCMKEEKYLDGELQRVCTYFYQ